MRLPNLPNKALNRTSGHLSPANQRALRMTARGLRDAGLCATCNGVVDQNDKFRLMDISADVVHNGVAYNMRMDVELEIQRINHVFHVLLAATGSIRRGGTYHSLCSFSITRNPLRLRILFETTLPEPVRACFATCIVRQMHRHRAYLAREMAHARTTFYTGPVGVAEITRCLDDVVVRHR